MQAKLPETKNEITAAEFLTAVYGSSFKPRPWFYKATISTIMLDKDIAYYGWSSDDYELEYIVLKDTNCTISEHSYIQLDSTTKSAKGRGFIFYNSILPEFVIREIETHDWILINSHIGDVTIDENGKTGNLIIVRNSVAGDISITDKCSAGSIYIEKNSTAGSISITQSSQCGDINIVEGSQARNIYVAKKSEVKDIRIAQTSKCNTIEIKNSIADVIWIKEESQIGFISINDRSKCGHIFMYEFCQSGPILLDIDSIISFIILKESKCTRISLVEGVQCEAMHITENSQVGELYIRSGHVKEVFIENNYCSIILLGAIVPLMRMNNCHIHELKWQAGTKSELYIADSFINYLNLSNTALPREAVLSLTNCSLNVIQLQELIILGILILRNISVLKEHFTWQPELNQVNENTKFNTINYTVEQQIYKEHHDNVDNFKTTFTKRPLFRIANCSLGKTEITGSDLEAFRLEYRDSRLLEVFISGTKLPPTNIYCPPGQTLTLRETHEQKVAIYNQLKRISDNQGDIVESTLYHSRAMDSQKNLLKLVYRDKHNPKWYSINKWFTDEGFDLFNFRLNRFSNNHGESWRRALAFTIGISLLFYTCYYISLNYYKSFSFTSTAIGDFIGNYFAFFDLTHKMDFMVDKSDLNATAKFLDFIGRIAIGYSIYQLIAAFRRHGRK